MAQVPSEHWEEAKDFDGEEGQRENVSGAGQAGGEDCGGHDGGIGGEGGRESVNHQSWCFLK